MDWRMWIRAATATAFATAMVNFIWRVEWFDVFRWGMPTLDLLVVYACYVAAAGAIGWVLAAAFTARNTSS